MLRDRLLTLNVPSGSLLAGFSQGYYCDELTFVHCNSGIQTVAGVFHLVVPGDTRSTGESTLR